MRERATTGAHAGATRSAGAAAPRALRLPQSTLLRHLLLALVAAIVLFLLTLVLDPLTNLRIAQIAFYAIAVAGLTILMGLNGQISLGHGAFMMVGAYTAALLLRAPNSLPLVVILILAVIVTAIVGLAAGAAAARLRGPYLAGATLALAVGLPALTSRYASVLGGDNGLSVPAPRPPDFLGADFPVERWQAWICLAFAVLTILLLANLIRSRVGRTLRAVRDDEVAAALAGINVPRTQVLAFVISAACAGLAGGLLVVTTSLAAPGAFTLALSLALLTGVILGGLGSLAGAVYGAIILVLLPTYMTDLAGALHLSTNVTANLPLAIYGVVLAAVMLAFPGGIQGGLRRLAQAFRSSRQRAHAAPPAADHA